MGPLGAESAVHGVRYIVRYSRRVCRSKSLKKALLTGPMSVISLDSGGEDTRHSTHTSHTPTVWARAQDVAHSRGSESRFCGELAPPLALHLQIHLTEPARSHAVGIGSGDGARSVTCCFSMSTCVTYTKPATQARSRSSHFALSLKTTARIE